MDRGGASAAEVALRDLVRQALRVESEIEAAINELKPGRRLYANVEFYAGVLMSEVGLPPSMFTPTFAAAWSAGTRSR